MRVTDPAGAGARYNGSETDPLFPGKDTIYHVHHKNGQQYYAVLNQDGNFTAISNGLIPSSNFSGDIVAVTVGGGGASGAVGGSIGSSSPGLGGSGPGGGGAGGTIPMMDGDAMEMGMEQTSDRNLCGAGSVMCEANRTGGVTAPNNHPIWPNQNYDDGRKIALYSCSNSGGQCSFFSPSNDEHVFGANIGTTYDKHRGGDFT